MLAARSAAAQGRAAALSVSVCNTASRLTIIAGMPQKSAPLLLPDTTVVESRRRAISFLAVSAALGCADATGLGATLGSSDAHIARAFTVFCDTLVPADALTPAASALGVPVGILDNMRGNALAQRLLAAACDWLDAQCGGDFAASAEAMRVSAVERMAVMPWESPAGRFYQVMRSTVMADYYSQPAAWRGLALDRPPQPIGFPGAVR